MFKKTLVIGLGLIGGSFAKALRQHKISKEIFACDVDSDALALAQKNGTVDDAKEEITSFENELATFDFIVIAAPLAAYEEIIDELLIYAKSEALIIDLGSIKNITDGEKLPPNFVLCHPIAGSEQGGFENSSADLFSDKKFIICRENSAENFIKKASEVAEKIGSKIDVSLSATRHDEIYAAISHLPQFLSFLTAEFSPKNIKNDFIKTAFRLDESSPEIWEGEDGIFALNEENLEKLYVNFFDNLIDVEKKFVVGNFVELLKIITSEAYKLEKKTEINFDENFLNENFSAIFLRILVVVAYLKLPEVRSSLNYAGSGFRDFTSIVEFANFSSEKLLNLTQKNQQKIQKMLQEITK